jgi:hypothetical protein
MVTQAWPINSDFSANDGCWRKAAVRQRLWYIDLIPSYCGYDGDQRHFGRPSRDNGGGFACGDRTDLELLLIKLLLKDRVHMHLFTDNRGSWRQATVRHSVEQLIMSAQKWELA